MCVRLASINFRLSLKQTQHPSPDVPSDICFRDVYISSQTTDVYVRVYTCTCVCTYIYDPMEGQQLPLSTTSSVWLLIVYMSTAVKCTGGDFVWCPLEVSGAKRLWWTSNCFSTSTENLEQAMQVSGWVALRGMCIYMLCTLTHSGSSSVETHLSPPSGEWQGWAIVLEPYLPHTLQASFGEDAVETEEEILTCNVKCIGTLFVIIYIRGIGTIFRVFVVIIYTYNLHYVCSYRWISYTTPFCPMLSSNPTSGSLEQIAFINIKYKTNNFKSLNTNY